MWFHNAASYCETLEKNIPEAAMHLEVALSALGQFENNETKKFIDVVKLEAKERGVKAANVMKAIRIAVTGGKVTIYD